MRRTPDEVVMSHIMDPRRRTVFVEGPRDAGFLQALRGDGPVDRALLQPIDSVEVSVPSGGNRARVLALAEAVADAHLDRIRFLVDADHHHVEPDQVPQRVWITDKRDLDWYVLIIDCLDHAANAAFSADPAWLREVFSGSEVVGRWLGYVRLASRRYQLGLPVTDTDVPKFATFAKDGTLQFQYDGCFASILGRAGIPGSEFESVREQIAELESELEATPTEMFASARDILRLIDKACSKEGRAGATNVLRAAFQREWISRFPVLDDVVLYLT